MTAMIELRPGDLGLPDRFTEFRTIQLEGIEWITQAEKRWLGLGMPTGSGKSLTVMGAHKILGGRMCVLTGTKGLQDQYLREFGPDKVEQVNRRMGIKHGPDDVVDMRGKANYQCVKHPQFTCADGQKCGCGIYGGTNCSYGKAQFNFFHAPVGVTNYAYWLNLNRSLKKKPGSASGWDTLVMDEAHLAHAELSRFLSISVTEKELRELGLVGLHDYGIPSDDNIPDWKRWAKYAKDDIKSQMSLYMLEILATKSHKAIQHHNRLESMLNRVEQIADTAVDTWVLEKRDSGKGIGRGVSWHWDCVWPGQYAERYLFAGIPRVILVSATIRPKTMGLLGIGQDKFEFREWPKVFPANRCPVYHIPTVRMSWRTSESELREWVEQIDQIIDDRLDRKGIIHTVAYHRQQYLMTHSRHKQLMVGNTADPFSPSASEVVSRFRRMEAPAILCSPSFSTGWDFPGEDAEYQIISKLPFPNGSDKIMKARVVRDPQYLNYTVMQELVQACGRPMRSAVDRAETFIVDDNISWFYYRNRHLAPKWFEIRKMAKVPTPPNRLKDDPIFSIS